VSVKPFAIAASVTLISAILLATLAIDPLKRAWWDYLNEHASEYYVHQMLAFNARIDLNLPTGSVLFYGDSMVQGLAVANAADIAINYGVGHATSQHVYQQLRNHRNVSRAKAVVIAVGINDITRGNASQVLPNVQEGLKHIPKAVPVIISKLMPVNEEALGRNGLSANVALVNLELEQVCSDNQRVRCIDAGQLLAASDGNLARQYHTGDGLHLNPRGNAIWREQLQLAIEEVSNDPSL
jgi:lysophospholipase L1-like esterase